MSECAHLTTAPEAPYGKSGPVYIDQERDCSTSKYFSPHMSSYKYHKNKQILSQSIYINMFFSPQITCIVLKLLVMAVYLQLQ